MSNLRVSGVLFGGTSGTKMGDNLRRGGVLGPVGAILGSLGTILGPFGIILDPLGAILGPFWGHLGPSGGHLDPAGAVLLFRIRRAFGPWRVRQEVIRRAFGPWRVRKAVTSTFPLPRGRFTSPFIPLHRDDLGPKVPGPNGSRGLLFRS